MEYFDTEYNVQTGEIKVTPWTQEKIDFQKKIWTEIEAAKPTVEELQAKIADLQSKLNSL
jgi:hypothetical protein